MKFAVLIGDGMGDYPHEYFNGKTVLEASFTPNMDWIASNGKGGLAATIPESMHPGSDVANMELLGYDTTEKFTGRSVFEALSMGKHLGPDDIAFRANLVTLENGLMKDYSAGHITTEEAEELMNLLDSKIGSETLRFHPGVSYRHLMVKTGGTDQMQTTPPHDIIDQEYSPWLPTGDGGDEIRRIMDESRSVLADAVVNKKRIATGKLPANSLWLWGQGRPLEIMTIEEKFGLKGAVISAVDLIKGIGVAAGLSSIFVPGATGYIDTNYRGKAEAALKVLEDDDFVYVHVEAPDEAGHNGDPAMKKQAIEDFDREVVGTILESYKNREDLAIIVTCDHRTPLVKRTHTRESVPFAFVGPGVEADAMESFSEQAAEQGSSGQIIGNKLLNHFIGDFIAI